MKDAVWIADLLAMGLICGSFVPPAPIFELRDLTRTRKQPVRDFSRDRHRHGRVFHAQFLRLKSRRGPKTAVLRELTSRLIERRPGLKVIYSCKGHTCVCVSRLNVAVPVVEGWMCRSPTPAAFIAGNAGRRSLDSGSEFLRFALSVRRL
jgi:hypothetical protein